MRIHSILCIATLALLAWACNPEKEVDLKIPAHERLLVVECFLEPGRPYRLTLTESVGFFDGPEDPFIDDALVVISHDGIHDTLVNNFGVDTIDFRLSNYSSTAIVPEDYDTEFSLYVRDGLGREVRGTTKLIRPVEFSNFIVRFDEDSLAALTVQWPDIVGQKNYYRFTMHLESLMAANGSNDALEMAFTLDDRIGDGEEFTISTFNDFEKGQRLICTVYHISEAYWRYAETASLSADANGNPFANPVTIYSTVEGGFGVFTGLNYDRDTVLIQ